MDVRSENFAGVFNHGGSVHYILPRFQRAYAWRQENWQAFWDDVIDTSQRKTEHFMGAMVVIDEGARGANMPTFTLVDGQQRLITLSTFLCALGDLVDDENLRLDIRDYLINKRRRAELAFKVLPTEGSDDKGTWIALVKGENASSRKTRSHITEAYDFFKKKAEVILLEGQIAPRDLLNTLMNRLQIVFINLQREERPHQIFESLNARGVKLTQPDLVRNYIAMRLSESEQERVFREYWRPIEEMLIEEKHRGSQGKELTNFLRHYLTAMLGNLLKLDRIYALFRKRMEDEGVQSEESFVCEIAKLHRFAGYYQRFLRPKENEAQPQLRDVLERLNNWEVTVSYPFLLNLYDEYEQGGINLDNFLDSLTILENYLVRRHLAGVLTAGLSRIFPALFREIDCEKPIESLKRSLEVRDYPSDGRLHQATQTHPIGSSSGGHRLVYILSTIDRHLSQEKGVRIELDAQPTIEHIMPRTLSDEWKKHLGSNWPIIHRDHLHTLGNLTLVTREWNSSLSNSPFSAKRARLARHGLLINSGYFNKRISRWDEAAIKRRAKALVDDIIAIWPTFGESPSMEDYKGTRPASLRIFGENYEVRSWKQLTVKMLEVIAERIDNFDEFAESWMEQRPRRCFARNPHPYQTHQLANGWWFYYNQNANDMVQLCEQLALHAGLHDEDWGFTIRQ